jgi:hypothetical protein
MRAPTSVADVHNLSPPWAAIARSASSIALAGEPFIWRTLARPALPLLVTGSAAQALHWPGPRPGEVAEWLKALAC